MFLCFQRKHHCKNEGILWDPPLIPEYYKCAGIPRFLNGSDPLVHPDFALVCILPAKEHQYVTIVLSYISCIVRVELHCQMF